eukprot:6175085-Pleurochrysis_carterae.AAC.1
MQPLSQNESGWVHTGSACRRADPEGPPAKGVKCNSPRVDCMLRGTFVLLDSPLLTVRAGIGTELSPD